MKIIYKPSTAPIVTTYHPISNEKSERVEIYKEGIDPIPKNQPTLRKVRLLSIDGGGIKGIVPATVLCHLEQRLREKTANPDARLCDYFDFFAGTSTGGILVSTYLIPDPQRPGRPRLSARQTMDLYRQEGHKIFERPLGRKWRSLLGLMSEKYSAEALARVLRTFLGETAYLSDLLRPCLIPAYDITRRRAHFFNSLEAAQDPALDFPAWQAAMATSAAPFFFGPVAIASRVGKQYALLDGGVFATNPAVCAYTEAHKACFSQLPRGAGQPDHPTARDMILVSIGTGGPRRPYRYEELKAKGALGWIRPLTDILTTAALDTTDYQLRQLFGSPPNCHNGRYYRLTPELREAAAAMDDVRPGNLRALHRDGLRYIEENYETLEKLADELIAQNGSAGRSTPPTDKQRRLILQETRV